MEGQNLGYVGSNVFIDSNVRIGSFEKDIAPCDEVVCQIKRQEFHGEIDQHIHDICMKFRVEYCKHITDLALDRLRSEVQQLETRLDSGELPSDLGELLQKLKDGALSTSLIRLSVQYANHYPFSQLSTNAPPYLASAGQCSKSVKRIQKSRRS
jgi:hypothetical protein